jgi:tRNA threonylcarbamoyladenosine modification (KEOPS) complex Cgi121 subunit
MNELYVIKRGDNVINIHGAFIKLNLKEKCVYNERLIELLALQTLESFKNGEMLARKPDIDFIMRLSLTDQIKQAEEICLGGDVQLFIFDNYDKLPFSDFTEQELDISEKAALLSVE